MLQPKPGHRKKYDRDYFINNTIESKDIDIEIYTNKKYEEILDLLTHKNYRCDIVGKNFGVIKPNDENNYFFTKNRKINWNKAY